MFTLVHFLVILIIVAAVCAVVYVILKAMGIAIPPWVLQVFAIILAAAVGIIAIKLLLSLA